MRRSMSVSIIAVAILAVAPLSDPLAAQSMSIDASAPVDVVDRGGPQQAAVAVSPRPLATAEFANTPAPSARRASGFASSGFAQFMSSPAGRILRVVAGAGMIAGGISADSNLGTGVAVAGAVPLLAGTFDFCVLSPLFGGPLRGKDIRAARAR